MQNLDIVDVAGSGRSGTTIIDQVQGTCPGTASFDQVNRMVQSEPWLTRHKITTDLLWTIGIEKGKPFNPGDAAREIRQDAVIEAREWMNAQSIYFLQIVLTSRGFSVCSCCQLRGLWSARMVTMRVWNSDAVLRGADLNNNLSGQVYLIHPHQVGARR